MVFPPAALARNDAVRKQLDQIRSLQLVVPHVPNLRGAKRMIDY